MLRYDRHRAELSRKMKIELFSVVFLVYVVHYCSSKSAVFDYYVDEDGSGKSLDQIRSVGKASVMYLAKWCPTCRKLHPRFIDLANVFPEEFRFIVLDCDKENNQEICLREDIRVFPVFGYWRNGVKEQTYYSAENFTSGFVPMIKNDID